MSDQVDGKCNVLSCFASRFLRLWKTSAFCSVWLLTEDWLIEKEIIIIEYNATEMLIENTPNALAVDSCELSGYFYISPQRSIKIEVYAEKENVNPRHKTKKFIQVISQRDINSINIVHILYLTL